MSLVYSSSVPFKSTMANFIRPNSKSDWYPLLASCILLLYDVNSQPYPGTRVWECGKPGDDKTHGGQLATPWTVAIYDNEVYDEEWKYVQAGTLVGLQTVITCGSPRISSTMFRSLAVRSGLNGSNFEVRKIELLQRVSDLRVDNSNRDLYLLHLKDGIPISSTSRPICLDPSLGIFENRKEYHSGLRNRASQRNIYLAGYVMTTDEHSSILTAQISPPKRWRIRDWGEDYVTLLETSITLFGYNFQKHENPYLPRLFNHGSALVYKKGERWFLLGVILRAEIHSRTQIRSVEKLTSMIQITQQCASHQTCSDEYCLPASCDKRVLCQCSSYDYTINCRHPVATRIANKGACQDSGNNSSYSSQSEMASVTNIEVSSIPPKLNLDPEQEGVSKSTNIQQGSSMKQEAVNTGNSMEIAKKCPPINLGPSATNIDISCRWQNGSRAGLICSEQHVELGSTAVLACTVSDTNMKKVCTSTGIWDPPTNLECLAQETLNNKRSEPPTHLSMSTSTIKVDVPKESEVVRCPVMELDEGVEIRCSGSLNGTGDVCLKEALPNTIIRLSCKPFYIPLQDTTLEKTCDSSGTWLPRKSYACTIDCGVTDISKLPFIVHGSKTPSEIWPWHAAIFIRGKGTYDYLCGGSLISRSILVTAAHCIQKATRGVEYQSNYKVAIGAISSNYIINLKDEQTQIFDISNVTINPHYNNRSYDADIALIRLSKSVTLSEFVRPVCFPYPTEKNAQLERYQLSEGNYGYVIGFGTDESWNISLTLKMAKIPYVSVKECTRVLERQPTISQYCAGYTNGTSVCEGDSGGGMFFPDESSRMRFYIEGVISHGSRDYVNARCDNEKYSVFTRVAAFSDWVKSVVDSMEYDYQ